jgi:hypothetical protein
MNKSNEHSGVQGVLTLNYECYEDSARKEEIAFATQLSAGDDNTVMLVEYNQEKGIVNNVEESKSSTKYKISAEKLVSLIKENGDKIK